jgi:hypothetical protein
MLSQTSSRRTTGALTAAHACKLVGTGVTLSGFSQDLQGNEHAAMALSRQLAPFMIALQAVWACREGERRAICPICWNVAEGFDSGASNGVHYYAYLDSRTARLQDVRH